jgi:hypothetical protein
MWRSERPQAGGFPAILLFFMGKKLINCNLFACSDEFFKKADTPEQVNKKKHHSKEYQQLYLYIGYT